MYEINNIIIIICDHVVLVVCLWEKYNGGPYMSPCCVSCRACEKSITEAPICHHVVLVVVPVIRV